MNTKWIVGILSSFLVVVMLYSTKLSEGMVLGFLGLLAMLLVWWRLPNWMRKLVARFALVTDFAFGYMAFKFFGDGKTATGLIAAVITALLTSVVLSIEREQLLGVKNDFGSLLSAYKKQAESGTVTTNTGKKISTSKKDLNGLSLEELRKLV